jgi:hypothetical protein
MFRYILDKSGLVTRAGLDQIWHKIGGARLLFTIA